MQASAVLAHVFDKKLRKDVVFINEKIKVSIISIIINIILTSFKILAGFLGNSKAMISDGIHSLSDVLSTIIVIIGIKMSEKEPDDDHPYGHERIECISAIILGISLLFVSGIIGMSGIKNIINPQQYNIGIISLIAAIISIIIKEIMFLYTLSKSKKLNSCSLKADAYHHHSDALSSIGSLIGIIFSIFGYSIMDSVASLIISIFILKTAFDIIKDGFSKLVDHSCDADTISKIKNVILSVGGVEGIDDLKTREFGDKIFIDVEILVNKDLTLISAHSIAENVHSITEKEFEQCKHCMVHVNPNIKNSR